MALLRHTSPSRIATGPPTGPAKWGFGATCLIFLALAWPTLAQPVEAPESRVKAAFLYNFTKLVDWPTNAFVNSNAPLVVGVLGKDPFGKELDNILAGRTGQGRPLHAVRYQSAAEATNCHVLFISDSEQRSYDSIFKALAHKPILTVGDTEGFATQGMIELTRSNDNIGLRINLDAANQAGLQLSSRLIRLDRRLWPSASGSTNAPAQDQK